MKKITKVLALTAMLLSLSCNNKPKNETNTLNDEKVVSSKQNSINSNASQIVECEEYFNKYETWLDDLATFMEKYEGKPLEMIGDPAYSELLMESSSFSSNWMSLAKSCEDNPNYKKRYVEIVKKMKKRMEKINNN